jgi:hypothetical protein
MRMGELSFVRADGNGASDHYPSKGLSANKAPLTTWNVVKGQQHFVQFYESDTFLVLTIADYLSQGLRSGDTCILAATSKHISMLERFVQPADVLDNLRSSGRYITLEADQTLSEIMDGQMPDEKRFRSLVTPYIEAAISNGTSIRIFGELVAVLAERGNPEASSRLEEYWNRLRKEHPFSLFCAYPTKVFAGLMRDQRTHICDEHTVVIPDETYTTLRTDNERLRKIASLQHRIKELEAELDQMDRTA